jgi:MFS family permease
MTERPGHGQQPSLIAGVSYALRAARGLFTLNLPVSARVRRDFKLDLLGAVLYGVFNGAVVGYMLVVARTIGVNQTGIGFLVAAPALGAILSLPVSLAVTGARSRPFLMLTFYLGRAPLLLLLFVASPSPYMVATSAFFIFGSLSSPFYAEVMQHIYPSEFRGRLMSLVRIGTGVATTLSSLGAAYLLGTGDVKYQVMFAVGAVLALAATVVFARITPVRPPPRPRQSLRDTFGILVRDKPFAQFQLALYCMGIGNIMAGTLYPLVIVDKLHAGYGPFGVLAVITALGYLVSWVGWGRVVDRAGPVSTILLAEIFNLALPAGMLVAPSVYWLAPAMFLNGIANAGFEIGPFASSIYFCEAEPHDVPRYMALHSMLYGTRGLACPFIATLLLAGNRFMLSIGTSLVIAVAGTVLMGRLFAIAGREDRV